MTAAATGITGLGLLLAACTAPSSVAGVALVRTEPLRAFSERVVAIADDGTRRLVLTDHGASVVRGVTAIATQSPVEPT